MVLGLLALIGGIATGYMLGYFFPVEPEYRFAPCDCVMFRRELIALHAKHAQCSKPKGMEL